MRRCGRSSPLLECDRSVNNARQDTAIGPIGADWKLVDMGTAAEPPQYGFTASASSQGNVRFLRITDLDGRNVDWASVPFCKCSSADVSKYLLRPGDLLFARIGATTGKSTLIIDPPKAVFASYLIRVRPKPGLDPGFLSHFFQSEAYWRQIDSSKNANLKKGVSGSVLKSLLVPEPPLHEQRQIAAILSAVQRAIERQERLIVLTAELKKALMSKLFTEGTRGEPLKHTEIGLVPESWVLKRCDEFCPTISVGVVVKPHSYYLDDGVPAFRSFNVREDRLIADDLVYFSHADNNGALSKSKLRAGDVLIVRTGYPGTSCVVPREFDGANCVDIVFARPDSHVQSAYLSRFLNSCAGRTQATASSHGLAQQHLNVGAVKRILVPLPTLDEQRKIVETLAASDRKADSHTRSVKLLTNLFRTLLHQLMTAEVRLYDLDISILDQPESESVGAV
jgi:type I restriction enzyme, S subunit